MIISTIGLSLMISIFGLGVITTGQRVDASIGSDEFCAQNPGHFACDGKLGNQDLDENDDGEKDRDDLPDNNKDGEITEADDWSDSCRDGGHEDGQNGPFDKETYSHCKEGNGEDDYYEGFIDGCVDAGNTRDVCVSATDA